MRAFFVLLAAAFVFACNGGAADTSDQRGGDRRGGSATDQTPKPPLAIFTSLPIYWAEGDIDTLLSGEAREHWAKQTLSRDYHLQPMDRLTALGDPKEGGIPRLLMAQPRALAPDENVALDKWVRSGGRLILLADPMMDAHSAYGLGDRRRPEAIAMLSPILSRWGLELIYDETQGDGWRRTEVKGFDIAFLPVSQAGEFRRGAHGHNARCDIYAGGLVAHCLIGEGTVLAVADAAFIQDGDVATGGAEAALEALLRSFERRH